MSEQNIVKFTETEIYDLAFIYGVDKHMIESINSFNSYDGAVYHIKLHSKYDEISLDLVIKCSKEISFHRTDLHLQLMNLLNKNNIPCPKPTPIKSDQYKNKHPFIHITRNKTIIHCMNYVKGIVASKCLFKNNILFYRSLGNVIGNISKCLKSFENKNAHFDSEYLWDIRNTNKAIISNLKYIINDNNKLKLITYYFNQYTNIIQPNIKYLKHSIIHGDLSDDNILCFNNKVVAVFDFDAHFTCTVFELAICCSYFMAKHNVVEKGIEIMLEIIYGYNEIYALSILEIKVLWSAICCRMVISAMEGEKYMLADPNNKYITQCNYFAWNFLQLYADCNPTQIMKLIKQHLNQSKL